MKKLMLAWLCLAISIHLFAQVGINNDGTSPDPSAILDLNSSDKGLLLPRMTTQQMLQVDQPATGLLVFNSDSVDLYMFNGSYWLNIRTNDRPIYPDGYFECGWEIEYEGQNYGTVQIGTQCWMSENLNVGSIITTTASDNGIIEKFCYGNTPSNCASYGGMYSWDEMMQYTSGDTVQGICPPGWHIPGDAEWCMMTTYIDATVNCNLYSWSGTNIGPKLRTTTGYSCGVSGTDDYGFHGLPGGIRSASGDYFDLGTYGYWWSKEPYGENAWNRRITCYQPEIGRFFNTKTYASAVRCVKD